MRTSSHQTPHQGPKIRKWKDKTGHIADSKEANPGVLRAAADSPPPHPHNQRLHVVIVRSSFPACGVLVINGNFPLSVGIFIREPPFVSVFPQMKEASPSRRHRAELACFLSEFSDHTDQNKNTEPSSEVHPRSTKHQTRQVWA